MKLNTVRIIMNKACLVLALWGMPCLSVPPDIIVDVKVSIHIVDNRTETSNNAEEDHFGCCCDDDLEEVIKAQKEQYDSKKAKY